MINNDKCRCSLLNLGREHPSAEPGWAAQLQELGAKWPGCSEEALVLLQGCPAVAVHQSQPFLCPTCSAGSTGGAGWGCAGSLMLFLTLGDQGLLLWATAGTFLGSLRGLWSGAALGWCLLLQLGLQFGVNTDGPDGPVPAGSLMSPALLPCRSCSLHWHGNKNGSELPREISETLCSRKVSIQEKNGKTC